MYGHSRRNWGYIRDMYTIDFETYSEAGYYLDPALKICPVGKGGLSEVGVYPYIEHPSFEPLCMWYRSDDGDVNRLWLPGGPPPFELLKHVSDGGIVEAHNVTFEHVVWNLFCVPAYGWPELKLEQTRCGMAKCRRHSLPGALGKAAEVIGSAPKDPAGVTLVRKLTRPHTPTKNRPTVRWTPTTAPDDFQALYTYCGQDVAAETDLSRRVPDLTEYERAAWIVDQKINHRGVRVDTASLDACIKLLDFSIKKYADEFTTVTGGAVMTVNENQNFKNWLNSRGVCTDSVDKASVIQMLQSPALPSDVKRALELRQILGGSNNKKLYKLKHQPSKDGRLRTQYMYCGADRTGRWSAPGVQLQNITADGPDVKVCGLCDRIVSADTKECICEWPGFSETKEWNAGIAEQALSDIRSTDCHDMLKIWGDPGALLSGCLRGLFIAAEGCDLMCADFSAIEAVALACLSRCAWRIDVFNTHGKIYETTASKISGVPLDEITPELRKKLGKIPELASGYGGWISAWKRFGADKYFNSDEEIKNAILTWRADSPEITEFWGGQHRQVGAKPWESVPELYGLEGAAVAAILNPGEYYQCIDISYVVGNNILYCRLPSGRLLQYHSPRLVETMDYFNRPIHTIMFKGNNSNPEKGGSGWIDLETYGGRLAENVTQAVAADIQTEALVRVENAGYPIVMHTHDEMTAEVPENSDKTLAGMIELMTACPTWASWWPIRANGWVGKRFKKG